MITDAQLRKAAEKSSDLYLRYIERDYNSTSSHEFSASFEKKIRKLRKRVDHPYFYKTLHKAAAVILAILISGSAWLAVDTEARAAFFGWVKEHYEMFFVYRFAGKSEEVTEPSQYQLELIPDGYSEKMTIDENGSVTVIYADNTGKRLKFGYMYNPNSTEWYIDTTNTIHSNSYVNGQPADLFISTSREVASIIMWTEESVDVAFYVSGFFDESTLIQLAESTRNTNLQFNK